MHVTRRTASAIVFGLASGSASLASTAEPDLDWFRAAWQQSINWRPTGEWYLSYSVEEIYRVDPAQVRLLEEKVAGKPDHPERRRLETLGRQLSLGTERWNMAAWVGPGEWRLNQDSPSDAKLPYLDVAVSKDAMWSLAATTLTVVDPRNPAEGNDLRSFEPTLAKHWSYFVNGSLGQGAATAVKYAPSSAQRLGEQWSAEIVSASGARTKQMYGVIVGGWPRVREAKVTKSTDAPQFEGERVTYSDFRDVGGLPHAVAFAVDEYDRDGNVRRRYRVEEFRPANDGELARAIRPPALGGEDIVRNLAAIKTIKDMRPAAPTLTFVDEGTSATLELPKSMTGRAREWLRPVGWTIVVLVASVLVILRARKLR